MEKEWQNTVTGTPDRIVQSGLTETEISTFLKLTVFKKVTSNEEESVFF